MKRLWVERLIIYVLIVGSSAIVSQAIADNASTNVQTTIVKSQREGCERANATIRPNVRFLLREVKHLATFAAPKLPPEFQGYLLRTLPGIQARIIANRDIDCQAFYPLP